MHKQLNISLIIGVFGLASMYSEEPVSASKTSEVLSHSNSFIEEKQGIFVFENTSNRAVTVMQFQLRGIIDYVRRDGESMLFQFKGSLVMRVTGVELFNPNRRQRIDKWDVVDLPVIIKAWNPSEQRWAGNMLSFEQAFDKAAKLSKGHSAVQAAVKSAKLTFADSGDLLRLEGEQIVIREEESSHASRSAVDH